MGMSLLSMERKKSREIRKKSKYGKSLVNVITKLRFKVDCLCLCFEFRGSCRGTAERTSALSEVFV